MSYQIYYIAVISDYFIAVVFFFYGYNRARNFALRARVGGCNNAHFVACAHGCFFRFFAFNRNYGVAVGVGSVCGKPRVADFGVALHFGGVGVSPVPAYNAAVAERRVEFGACVGVGGVYARIV